MVSGDESGIDRAYRPYEVIQRPIIDLNLFVSHKPLLQGASSLAQPNPPLTTLRLSTPTPAPSPLSRRVRSVEIIPASHYSRICCRFAIFCRLILEIRSIFQNASSQVATN